VTGRVFALAPDCHVPGWRYGPGWRAHFYEGLRSAGLEVVEPTGVDFSWSRPVQVESGSTHHERKLSSEEIEKQILAAAAGGLDAVVSYCFSQDIELDLVDRVRALGVPWINFFCDSLYAFETVADLAARTSLNWFVESAARPLYEALDVPFIRAPYALNPGAVPDAECLEAQRPLAFIGAAHPQRLRTATLLRVAGSDLHVAGFGWPDALSTPVRGRGVRGAAKNVARAIARRAFRGRCQGHLEPTDFIEYLRSTQVLLGLNAAGLSGASSVNYLKLRDLEFPGMGCCYLVEDHEDLVELFEDEREIVRFSSLAEARRLARALARDPARCRAIGKRARERVLAEHSWAARWPQVRAALP